jgi:hypothetical protein
MVGAKAEAVEAVVAVVVAEAVEGVAPARNGP